MIIAKPQRRFLTVTVLWVVSTLLLNSIVDTTAKAYVHRLPVPSPTPTEIRAQKIQQETSDRFSLMQQQVEQLRANRAFEQKRREAVSMVTGWDQDISDVLVRLSDKYQIPVDHALGLIALESSFNIYAHGYNRNGTTDHGLMQLNDGGTLQWLGRAALHTGNPDPYDPTQNLQMGMWYLNYNMGICGGDWECVRSRYNGDRTGIYASKVEENVGKIGNKLLVAWNKIN